VKVAIVGLGVSGIFALRRLNELGIKDVIVFEQGKSIEDRRCDLKCEKCGFCSNNSGVGGAGLFSDGTFYFSDKVGGSTNERMQLFKDKVWNTIKELGAVPKQEVYKQISYPIRTRSLKFEPTPLLWLGSDHSPVFIRKLLRDSKCDLIRSRVTSVKTNRRGFEIFTPSTVKSVDALILATGQTGQHLLGDLSKELGIKHEDSKLCSLGVRLEMNGYCEIPSGVHNDTWRTFCSCPQGFVVMVNHYVCRGVNGHSKLVERSGRSNLAIMTRVPSNLLESVTRRLKNSPIVQRLGDFFSGQPTTRFGATKPTLKSTRFGSISDYLPGDLADTLSEFIRRLSGISQKVLRADNLLYYPEIKFLQRRYLLTESFETTIPKLFIVGDASGVVYSLFKSAVSGYVAGDEIGTRMWT